MSALDNFIKTPNLRKMEISSKRDWKIKGFKSRSAYRHRQKKAPKVNYTLPRQVNY